MCSSSVRKGECYNSSCHLKHVAGTKRTPDGQDDSRTNPQVNPQANPQSKNPQGSADFLDALRLLKAELLEAMDMKLALMASTQIPAAQSQTTQASHNNSNIVPCTAPPNWTIAAQPLMHSTAYGSRIASATQQPYGLVVGPQPHVPVQFPNFGLQGAQQQMYMAAAPPAQTH